MPMHQRCYCYCREKNSSNYWKPWILRQLREETASMRGSQMQVSPDQAQLLAMLVQILGAKRCIEIGVYTGYSSLAVALVLPDSGCLVACERDAKSLEVAKKYYERAGVSHKWYSRECHLETQKTSSLLDECSLLHSSSSAFIMFLCFHVDHEAIVFSYDFAFVDAEKRMNQEYFELLLQLVRVGGVIVIDNVLWHGKVADPLVNDAKTVSIRSFNKNIMEDLRVSISMVSLIGLVCFCCPGMFNALAGMGGGGQVKATAANNADTALYTTFSIFGILGGGIYNIFGPRLTLGAGCPTTYTFAIVAGAVLGIGAGLLWAGQGAIMTCYPSPGRRGIYIWSIFNTGGVIGGLIPFILNYHRLKGESSRRTRGYVGIGIVALLGTAIWGGGLANQLNYSYNDPPDRLDFEKSGGDFAGPFVLYFNYGLLDAMFQSMGYWVIGALADDSETLSRYSGFYKGVQSAGSAIAWQVDTLKVPLLSQLIVNWSLTTLGYPLLALLVMLAVKDDEKPNEGAANGSSPPSAPPAPVDDGYDKAGKSISN
ncbi:unnamed protein product [Dovyalis caffra]|uniref:Caffeoyl-CoA O-methyltransferase n=1 Tax=Dovyalis caffra TaxID=77055 RepID=A0AAV1SCL9_9ROSI|nr:unnamed protein product [Dovyalis caffra]